MKQRCLATVCLVMLVAMSSMIARAAGQEACSCHQQCPRCQHVCRLSVEQEKETRECFEVECKPICIPQITLPWHSCCAPKCARVKYVRTLKVKQYECERCAYRWTPEPCASCCIPGHPSAHSGAPELPHSSNTFEMHHLPPLAADHQQVSLEQAERLQERSFWRLLQFWSPQQAQE